MGLSGNALVLVSNFLVPHYVDSPDKKTANGHCSMAWFYTLRKKVEIM